MKPAETYHQFKNSLQQIISYSQILLSAKETVSANDLQRLIRFIHIQSKLQDLILDSLQTPEGGGKVLVNNLLPVVFTLFPEGGRIPFTANEDIYAVPRVAAMMGLVANEILSFSFNNKIPVENMRFSKDEGQKQRLSWTLGTELSAEEVLKKDLKLAQLIVDAEFSSQLSVQPASGKTTISFDFAGKP